MNFTAIDFETANGFRGSACAIGAVKYRNGTLVDTHYTLLKPPAGFDRFDPRNVAIHGITPDAVADAPAFAEHFNDLFAFIDDDVVVAHNACFDIGVIESGLEVSNRPIPHMEFACTLTLSRKNYQLASHALPSAAAEAGYVIQNHHNALEDASRRGHRRGYRRTTGRRITGCTAGGLRACSAECSGRARSASTYRVRPGTR